VETGQRILTVILTHIFGVQVKATVANVLHIANRQVQIRIMLLQRLHVVNIIFRLVVQELD